MEKESQPNFMTAISPTTYLYNTKLTPMQERDFQAWIKKLNKKTGRNVLNDLADYDLRAHFLSGGYIADNGHGSDIGKKPNHPTFSNQSKWSTSGQKGGEWRDPIDGIGNPQYIPSTQMMKNDRRMSELARYMKKYEPNVSLLSPYIAANENMNMLMNAGKN